MSAEKITRYLSGFGLSFLITSFANALLVIAKENYLPLKDGMKALSGHHWTTHGIFVLALFVILGLVFSQTVSEKNWGEEKLVPMILTGTIVGSLLIMGFFLIH